MCFMEGQGVDGHVGDDFLCCLCLSSSTLVSNGVDTMRSPCSALNVKAVRNWKQARETMILMMVATSALNVKVVENKRG